MRKLYTYKTASKQPVITFLQAMDSKLQYKLRVQLEYIIDERNGFIEPYVKHFSIAKYRQMYEIRVKAAEKMIRIIFYEKDGEIIMLHAFQKRDRKDTEKGLEAARRILDEILDDNGDIANEHKQEVKLCGKCSALA